MPDPQLVIFAGPNGSGKTTLYRLYADKYPLPFLNADELAVQTGSVAAASRKTIKRRRHFLTERSSFVWETTLAGVGPLAAIRNARSKGYHVTLYYIATSTPAISEDRIRQRVALGGHNVPDADIQRRYYRSLEHLQEAIDQCNAAFVFDNSEQRVRLVCAVRGGRYRKNTSLSTLPSWLPESLADLLP